MRYFIIFIIFLITLPVFSENLVFDKSYLYQIGLSASKSKYSNKSFENYFTKNDDLKRSTSGISFSFYFPYNSKILLGGIIYLHNDQMQQKDCDPDTIFFTSLFGLSSQYYFNKIGEGFFARGDIGYSFGLLKEKHETEIKTLEVTNTEHGYGFDFSGGYSFNFKSWSLNLELLYQFLKYKDFKVENYMLTLSILW